MFFFFARLTDDETYEILEALNNNKQGTPKFENAFRRLIDDFTPMVMSKARSWKSKSHLSDDQLFELVSITNAAIYENVKEIKYKDKKGLNKEVFKAVQLAINYGMAEGLASVIGETLKVSRPTKVIIKKVEQFIKEYQNKHKRSPDIKTIAKEIKQSEKVVEKIVDSLPVYRMKKLEDIKSPDGKTFEVDKWLESPEATPEVMLLKREQKRQLINVLRRLKPAFETRIKGTFAKEWEVLAELLKTSGKKQGEIMKKFKLPNLKLVSRIWQKFLRLVIKDKAFKEYFVTAQLMDQMIHKVSYDMVNRRYGSVSKEEFIYRVLNKYAQ